MKDSFTRFSSDVFPDFERLQEQMDAAVRNFGISSGIRAGALAPCLRTAHAPRARRNLRFQQFGSGGFATSCRAPWSRLT